MPDSVPKSVPLPSMTIKPYLNGRHGCKPGVEEQGVSVDSRVGGSFCCCVNPDKTRASLVPDRTPVALGLINRCNHEACNA